MEVHGFAIANIFVSGMLLTAVIRDIAHVKYSGNTVFNTVLFFVNLWCGLR